MVKIEIIKQEEYKDKCHLCERYLAQYFYDLNIEVRDNESVRNKYRHLCMDCNFALQRHYMGAND